MDFLKGAYGGGATGNPMAKLEQAGAKSAMGMTDLLAANMLMNSNKQQGTNYLQQQAPPYYGAQFNAPAYFGNQGQPNYFGTPQYNQFAPPSYFGGNQQNPFE